MEAVHRYEGTVNQVMGDGIMALFGAPVALEDHAVRATPRLRESPRPGARSRWRHGRRSGRPMANDHLRLERSCLLTPDMEAPDMEPDGYAAVCPDGNALSR
jgi:class 3 adenylate cyclase